MQRLLHVALARNVDLLIQGIISGDAIVVSDGSYKGGYGTAAVILTRAAFLYKLVIQAITPGDGKDMSSYRRELSGILASMPMVDKLCQVYGIQ